MLFHVNRQEFVEISKTAFHKWQANNATIRAAALAFFTILPLPSLLLIVIEVFTLIYGQANALNQLIQQITLLAGPTIADIVNELLKGSATNPLTSDAGSILTVVFAIVGAIGAFAVLQGSLNEIWEIKSKKTRTLKMKIRERMIPFFAVSFAAVILVGWTGITNVLFISISYLFGSQASLVLGGVQIILSFTLAAILFAIIYKMLPDTEIAWHDVLLPALLIGIISTALDYLFGVYIHAFPATSLAGTSGSVMILMLWIFVTDEFILFGAQFSKIYADRVGSRHRAQRQHKELPQLSKQREETKN
jgi:membrane protein